MTDSLTELHTALRAAWTQWTCDPSDQDRWTPDNRCWGQCGATALIVQDHLGGELLLATVHGADGTPQDWHYCNRLPDGSEDDLTRGQFRDGQVIGAPEVQPRLGDLSRARIVGHYALLSLRVDRALRQGADPLDSHERRPTIKAVCADDAGRVLLCRNHEGDWELPGGRPEVGEPFEQTVIRELHEETGIRGEVDRLIGARRLERLPGHWVDVVAYRCTISEPSSLRLSDEHAELAFRDPAALTDAELPAVYREITAAGHP